MIITAQIARELANQTQKSSTKWERAIIRELRGVEKAIARAAANGKKLLNYHCLHNIVKEVLRANGYKVQECGNYDYEWVVISWN